MSLDKNIMFFILYFAFNLQYEPDKFKMSQLISGLKTTRTTVYLQKRD